MATPKLSIIMPSYNVAALIPRAIESVLHQTFGNWELIVVDDGSPDNLREAVKSFIAKDKRIRLVTKPNGGLSDARNFGLNVAGGTYIHFFDPDDYLSNDIWYDSVFDNINNSAIPPDLIITGYYVGDETGNNQNCLSYRPLSLPFCGRFGEGCITHVCYAWNKFFRREFLTKNKLEYEKGLSRIEDAEFMSRMVKYRPEFMFIRNGGYIYVQREDQTLSKGFDTTWIDICKRRIGIDIQLIQFFNNSQNSKSDIIDCLKTSALISIINRLYTFSGDLSMTMRHEILDKIRILIPSHLITSREGLMNRIFDNTIYWSVKNRHYLLTDFAQKIRKTIRR